MIYDIRKHKTLLPRPNKTGLVKFFVYKQGKCYVENLTYSQLALWVADHKDILDIPDMTIVYRGGALGILRDNGFFYEAITTNYDKQYTDYQEDVKRCKDLYKQELKVKFFHIDCSNETFDKFYDMADLLCELPKQFEYAEDMEDYNRYEELECNLQALSEMAWGFRNDLKQK